MQTNTHTKMLVRCRGVVIYDGKMLVVRHRKELPHFALPGGHMDLGEGVKECMAREMVEELGVEPQIGRLLYVHTWVNNARDAQSMEFFFEITNGKDYLESEKLERSHAYEIAELVWMKPTDDIQLLPVQFCEDFKNGKVLADDVRFIQAL